MSDARLRTLERAAASSPESQAALVMAEVRAGKRRAVRPMEPIRIPRGACPECDSNMLSAEVVSWDEDTGLPVDVSVFCAIDDGDAREDMRSHLMHPPEWKWVRAEALAWARDHLWVSP